MEGYIMTKQIDDVPLVRLCGLWDPHAPDPKSERAVATFKKLKNNSSYSRKFIIMARSDGDNDAGRYRLRRDVHHRGHLCMDGVTGIPEIYREKETNPLLRFIGISAAIILGSMWAAVPIICLWVSPGPTIFGFIVIAGILFLILKSEGFPRR